MDLPKDRHIKAIQLDIGTHGHHGHRVQSNRTNVSRESSTTRVSDVIPMVTTELDISLSEL
jgi:hypothetical protein